jgi:hypothetical protein
MLQKSLFFKAIYMGSGKICPLSIDKLDFLLLGELFFFAEYG